MLIIGFFVAGFGVMIPLEETPVWDLVVIKSGGIARSLDWVDWHTNGGEFLIPLCIVLPFVGTMAWISHGITSTFSRWVFAVKYFAFSIFYIIFQLNGSTIGPVLWGYLAVLAFFASLCTLLAYWKDKKKMGIHFGMMAVVLLVTLLAGLL